MLLPASLFLLIFQAPNSPILSISQPSHPLHDVNSEVLGIAGNEGE